MSKSIYIYGAGGHGFVVAIGNNRIRLGKQRMLAEKGATFPVLIHPSAVVSRYAKVEAGCVVMAGAVSVGACSWVGIGASVKQCVQIGANVVVGAGAVVVSDIADNLIVVGVPAKVKNS